MVVDNYPASIEVRALKKEYVKANLRTNGDGGSHPSCLGVACDAPNRRLTLTGLSGP
jgi:hypothetical protein